MACHCDVVEQGFDSVVEDASEGGGHEGEEVVFDILLHELAWNIKHHLAVDEAVELDEGEGGRVLLGCDIVADDAETFIPHE